METLITVIHVVLCVFLIIVVLLQSGRSSGDVGAAFGGGGASSTVFGAAGATTLLGRITTGVAALFMVTSISLAWFSNRQAESVIGDGPTTTVTQPAAAEESAPAAGSGDTVEAPAPERGASAPAPGEGASAPASPPAEAPAAGGSEAQEQ